MKVLARVLVVFLICYSIMITAFLVIVFMPNRKSCIEANWWNLCQFTQSSVEYSLISANKKLEAQVAMQKSDKNEIRNIREDQAADNDKLVTAQTSLAKAVQDYLDLIAKSVRFVQGQPLFYPDVTEDSFAKARQNVLDEMSKLKTLQDANADNKAKYKARIDQLYLQAGEDQDNRFNSREGIRS